MMHMTLYWGKGVVLLIDSWKTDSWTSYALTLLACFLFSVFYQYMEDRRLRFKFVAASTASLLQIEIPLLSILRHSHWARPSRLISTVLFGVNSAIGYFLMLAIMSFNGGVFLAIVLGLTVGYYIFRSGDGIGEGNDLVVVDNACACS